jgi:UDP-N-acetylmuramyl pentapeptide phosphotransferase/UDP-N-acetylglucosamine-1-phosphate transferase
MGNEIVLLLPAIALGALTYLALSLFERFARSRRILLDVPSARSNHRRVMIRGGGVVFGVVTLIAWLGIAVERPPQFLPGLLVGGALVLLVGFLDDLKGLSVGVRLMAQVTAAAIFLSSIPPPYLLEEGLGVWTMAVWWPLALFFMVAVTNIYNFMDGIDGNTALHTSIVLATWTMMSATGGQFGIESLVCLALLVPLMAFLLHNWSPARIFMGDAGSTFLGFTLATLAVIQVPGVLRLTNFFTLTLLMMPFLFDATLTILTRASRGEPWYLPHREFLFHRLIRAGHSHGAVSLLYGAITLIVAGAVALRRAGDLNSDLVTTVIIATPFLILYATAERYAKVQRAEEWGKVLPAGAVMRGSPAENLAAELLIVTESEREQTPARAQPGKAFGRKSAAR